MATRAPSDSPHSSPFFRREAEAREPWPPQWMLDLERAHDQLRHGARLLENGAQPVIDLKPPAKALERAFAAIYAAYDEREDRLTSNRAALAELDAAMSALSPATSLDAAIGFAMEYLLEAKKALTAADDRLAPLIPRPRGPAPDMRASQDVPTLHMLDRPSLVPALRVPDAPPPVVVEEEEPPIPQPKTFAELDAAVEELKRRADARRKVREEKKDAERKSIVAAAHGEDAELPPGFAPQFAPAISELAFVRARTRDCFEEVAMVGTQRAPLLGDPWRSSLVLERRMLASLDAIVAMGPPALAFLETHVLDSPAKDPSRVFGIGMILGCVGGRDALASAERVFLALEVGDPEMAEQFGGALKLATNPLVPIALRTFLADPDPSRRALAIDVLAYRRMATLDELTRAVADEPNVAAAALPYFALTSHPGVRDAIESSLEKDNDALREAAWHAMALSGHPHAPNVLARELSGPNAEIAAQALAIVGDNKDAARLLEIARAIPKRAFVTAVGWAGAADAIVPLMRFLESEDDAVKLAAAYALDRITGAGLWEVAEVEPEAIMEPDVPNVDTGDAEPEPLARRISDPRDLPGQGAIETINQPTVRLDRWQAWWLEKQSHFDLKQRYRRGWQYTPQVSLRELDRFPATPGERRFLQRELVVRTGQHVRFDVHDFVVVQEEALKEWESIAQGASSMPGGWNRPMRRF